jgi:hypothetical protein
MTPDAATDIATPAPTRKATPARKATAARKPARAVRNRTAGVQNRTAGDDRAALRAAIAGLAQAKRRLGAHRQAIERAKDLARHADQKAARAAAQVERATQQAGLVAAEATRAGGNAAGGAGIIRRAKAHEQDSLDEQSAAAAGLSALEQATPKMELSVSENDVAVAVAVSEIIAQIARNALARFRQLRAEAETFRGILQHVAHSSDRVALPRNTPDEVRLQEALDAPLAELKAEIIRELTVVRSDAGRVAAARAKEWEAFAVALRTSPNAEAPAP